METDARIVARGERVWLARPQPEDADAFSALIEASRVFLDRWAPMPLNPREQFERTLAANTKDRYEKLFLVRPGDRALLGVLNFNEVVRGLFDSSYMGYWIGAAHARQGLMGEALNLALAYAFGPMRLHRVEANIQPENAASIALVRRAGFLKEGLSPRYLRIGGVWSDHERWALTREDYTPAAS